MKILCIHQSSELYGSDRSFLLCVRTLRVNYPLAEIDVILPGLGPLADLVRPHVNSLKFQRLCKIERRDLRFFLINKLGYLASVFWSRIREIRAYDVVYVNTTVIADYILALRFFSGHRIVHVREIPVGLAELLFGTLLKLSRAKVIANSIATKRFVSLAAGNECVVVENGIKGFSVKSSADFSCQPFRILMVGRINGWKGQILLLDALALLPDHLSGELVVRFVGGTSDGNDRYLELLKDRAKNLAGKTAIEIVGFKDDPQMEFEWANVVCVPSIKPEPFGLVAIEAMSAGRLVIAADHGGLSDIISHEIDGLLFEAGNAVALAERLEYCLSNRASIHEMARNGRKKFDSQYSDSRFGGRFMKAFQDIVGA